jgi:hypothetical protein
MIHKESIHKNLRPSLLVITMVSWNVFESSAKTIPLTSVDRLERRGCLILSLPQQWLNVAYGDTGDARSVIYSRKSGLEMD